MFAYGAVGNAAPVDLELLTVVVVDDDPRDVRVGGLDVVVELDAVALRAADHPFLVGLLECVQHGEIVAPSLREDEAPTGAGTVGNDRDGERGFDARVLGAVDEAAEVATVAVHEPRDVGDEIRHGREQRIDPPYDVEQHVGPRPVDPHQHVVRRGRRTGQIVGERRQRARRGGAADLSPQRRTERHHDVHAAGGDRGLAQPLQRVDHRVRRDTGP